MTLKVKTQDFEGPFDLLLHLIYKNKMNICDVRISKITEEYMEYLKTIKSMDMEVTSEFVLIAATLLEIKSNMLLPKKEEKEEESEIDHEKFLMEKLILYKKFKSIANFLKERYESLDEIYLKKPDIIERQDERIDLKELLKNVDVIKLKHIYEKLIHIHNLRQNHEDKIVKKNINLDKYKLENKVDIILLMLEDNENFKFNNLIGSYSERIEIIVTFLALLELMRLKQVVVYQEKNFSDILIERA